MLSLTEESFTENHVVNTRFGVISKFLLNTPNHYYSCDTEKHVRKTLPAFPSFRVAICQFLVLWLARKQQ